MKPIQVMFDESLLRLLDADEEVRRLGRSAVLRRAAADYLRRTRGRRIAQRYRRTHAERQAKGDKLEAWEEEDVPPEG
jgi:hypothetical protein